MPIPFPTRYRARKVVAAEHAARRAAHVHVFDRTVVDEDYLGVGARVPACACGATR